MLAAKEGKEMLYDETATRNGFDSAAKHEIWKKLFMLRLNTVFMP